MSLAWEVTQDDGALVLTRHGKIKSYDDPLVTGEGYLTEPRLFQKEQA